MTGHEHESWQLRQDPGGRTYCAACGAAVDSRPGPVDVGSGPGHDRYCAAPLVCMCEELAAARADERAEWEGDLSDSRHWAKETVLELAHAEAVAARLVEAIVEMQSDIDHAWAVANGEARR